MRGIPLRAVVPNAVTALALCVGLTSVRFAIAGQWENAIYSILAAAVLDGMDGRIARALRGQTRFGAELDSLSDVIAFGVSPAIVLHLWSLQHWPRIGWVFALAFAACQALRLARFNAQIDVDEQPHKSAGFLTGVPAPAGAGLLLLPVYLWLASGEEDATVRPRNSQNLAAAIEKAGGSATLRLYPGIGHTGIVMALSAPFRSRGPVLDEASDFLRGVTGRRVEAAR